MMKFPSAPSQLLQRQLLRSGYFIVLLALPNALSELVLARNWEELDQRVARETKAGGVIFEELKRYTDFSEIEFIISIRSSHEYPDEDGIWHDDGSRILAFSLSLTLNPADVDGGKLEIRKRGESSTSGESISTPPYGSMIVFATGYQGFEHKINLVRSGERIIIAGWCT